MGVGAKVRTALRYLTKALGVVVLILIILWMAYGFHERMAPGHREFQRPTAEGRQLAEARALTTTETIDAVGTIQPRLKTQVASQLLATIREISVNAGDFVRQGQVLVVLDDREIQAQLREATAAADGVAADLAVKTREYARYKQMYAEKAVTKEDFDRVEGAYHITQSQLQRAREQIERVKVLLTYTQIQARASGLVAERYADPGDLAAPGKPLLSIHDPTVLELHASVRESLASLVRTGMKLDVRVDSVNLQVEGTVREIVPQAETASRSVLVKVALPQDKTSGLYVGLFGRLALPVGSLERVVVPAETVQYVGQLELVEVVADDGTLHRRFVRTGQRFGDEIEILSGLSVGESVARPLGTTLEQAGASAKRQPVAATRND